MNINTILLIIGAIAIMFILLVGFFVIATADKEKDTEVDSIFHKELRRKALAESLYACVGWPEIQNLMGRPGFPKNAVSKKGRIGRKRGDYALFGRFFILRRVKILHAFQQNFHCTENFVRISTKFSLEKSSGISRIRRKCVISVFECKK